MNTRDVVRAVSTLVLLAVGVVASGCAESTNNAAPAKATDAAATASSTPTAGNALPKYLPVRSEETARAFQVEPKKGYLVKEIKPGVFVITDGTYQAMFFTTGEGVILLDAPQSLGSHIQQGVADVTKEPIRQLVYSHNHVDHIAGAETLKKANPNLEIIAEQGVADYLKEKQDHRRPMPTSTFVGGRTLTLGSAKLVLKRGNWHSNEGDLFVYAPDKKVLMAVDTLIAGYAPFVDLAISTNVHDWLRVFDQLLAYDFDVLVPGHLTSLATRDDVAVARDYANDLYKTVRQIQDTTDQMKIMSAAAETYTWNNQYAIYRTLLDGMIDQCDREMQSRWNGKVSGVDVFGKSDCRAMLVYVRWDD